MLSNSKTTITKQTLYRPLRPAAKAFDFTCHNLLLAKLKAYLVLETALPTDKILLDIVNNGAGIQTTTPSVSDIK
jgi:hypothetical protein